MQKKSTIIKIDIQNFNETAQAQSAQETAEYLKGFYDLVGLSIGNGNWRIVKAMGDCLLISAQDANAEKVKAFFELIRREYSVSCQYRECEYEEVEISFDGYSCLDVFGKEINNLFLHDEATNLLG